MFRFFRSKKNSVATKILVVDDEPDLVSTVQYRLEYCKFEVVTAGNGDEGLKKATP
jgi:DNA-binding response OmpR family regulator